MKNKHHLKTQSTSILAAVVLAAGFVCNVHAESITALDYPGILLEFQPSTPTVIDYTTTITGIDPNDTLTSIDYRPRDYKLFGLATNDVALTRTLYSFAYNPGVSAVATPLITFSNAVFGRELEFDPSRASGTGTIRLPQFGTGGNLHLTGANFATIVTDSDLHPNGFYGVRSAAYSRNEPGAGINDATTLYIIDIDSLYRVGGLDFPASGLSADSGGVKKIATISGRVFAGDLLGFDIYNDPNTAASDVGRAWITDADNNFYSLNLSTAAASPIGIIPAYEIQSIAAHPTSVPEPSTYAMYAVLGGVAGFVFIRNRRKVS